MMQKKCSKCELFKPLSEFRFLTKRGYYMAECKGCERLRKIKDTRLTKRELAVREVAVLCKLFDTRIVVEALDLLVENKV